MELALGIPVCEMNQRADLVALGCASPHPLLCAWAEHLPAVSSSGMAQIADLQRQFDVARAADNVPRPQVCTQDAALLADGLHYETRIAERGILATRAGNVHDAFNALVWLRHPLLKHALNARQVADITEVGPKSRTRGQCAMTQFDEAGAIVWCADPALLALWDAHDWSGLFLRERAAWGARIAVTVFGHALLERQFYGSDALSTAKTIAVHVDSGEIEARCVAEGAVIVHWAQAEARIARAIRVGDLLVDPQHPRPLPLAGIPAWHSDNGTAEFYRDAPCFRPLRAGRQYPAPLIL